MRKREQFEQFAKIQEDYKSPFDEIKSEVDTKQVQEAVESEKIPDNKINEV